MFEQIEKIRNKEDFIHYLYLLSEDFEKNPQEWENHTIPEFHEQMAG